MDLSVFKIKMINAPGLQKLLQKLRQAHFIDTLFHLKQSTQEKEKLLKSDKSGLYLQEIYFLVMVKL